MSDSNSLSSIEAFLLNQILDKSNSIKAMPSTQGKYPYFQLKESAKSPVNGVMGEAPSTAFKKVLQPTVVATRIPKDPGASKTKILLLIAAFINTDITKNGLLKEDDFSFYYNFSLNASGEPQLDIYITFNDEIKGDSYNYYAFEVGFESDSEILSQWQLDGVVTTQVFLYDKDPRTSRGTVTTVQGG